MKIGVYWGNLDPLAGGGYTFEISLLKSLIECPDNRGHQFYLFGYSFPYNANKISQNIKFVPLKRWKDFTFNKVIELINRKFFGYSSKRVAQDLYYRNDFHNQLNQLVRHHQIDIVWFLGPHFVPVECAYIFPVWDLAHRIYPFFPEVSLGGEWARREILYRAALSRASYILTGTDVGKDEILRFYNVSPYAIRKASFFLPTWVDEYQDKEMAPINSLGHLKGEFLFYPAQFWAHKNHVMLLRVIKILKEQYNLNYHLVFTGSDKGYLSHIQTMAQQIGVDELTHFLGFVSYEELKWLYQNAFALLFPTFFGPDNIPPLEAFAFGCPVLASNVSGAKEQYGEAALLFELGDDMALVNHILSLNTLNSGVNMREKMIKEGMKILNERRIHNYLNSIFSILDYHSNLLFGQPREK